MCRADRGGRGTMEIGLQRFLEDLDKGSTLLIKDIDLFDGALNAVIGNICENKDDSSN